MQDIVFYAAVNETQGIVRDSANARNQPAPVLVLGVSACLKMRLFAACNAAAPYPVASLGGITEWNWRMDADFDRETPSKLVADADGISVRTVTDTVDGETVNFTEFTIPISDMNTQELATWIGNERKRSGLIGELVGYDSAGKAVFVLQIDDFTVRNRVAGLDDPTAIDQEVATRSQTAEMIQAAVSSSAATKQDKLTPANAGTNISIDENGVISNTYSLPSATTGSRGGVILATAAETVSGSNTTKAITPAAFTSALSGGDPIIAKSAIQAFQPITELGSASSVSLKSGGAYRLSAVSGDHYLTVPDVPADKYGTDAHVELFVGNASLIHVCDPLVLMDALVPNAVNNCVIEFRDGAARMFVENHDFGYVVTVLGGTGGTGSAGSLHYGLTEATAAYIVFANSLNGQTVILPDAATVNRVVNIVGNGYTETVISGGVSCTSKTTFSNLGMADVFVLGGTSTLGDVFITPGATVGCSGGKLAVERVSGGSGAVIGLNSSIIVNAKDMHGIIISGGAGTYAGAIQNNSGLLHAVSCTFLDNASESNGGAIRISTPGSALLSSCTFEGNTNGQYSPGTVFVNGATASALIDGCTFKSGQTVFLNGSASVTLAGSNVLQRVDQYQAGGYLFVSSGAILDLTGVEREIPINPGHGITLYGGHYETPTTIIGSGGVSRTFEDLEIHGSSITNLGLICGATVYSNEGDDHEVRYTEDNGATSSSVFISGQTAFVVPGALMQVINT